MTTLLTKADLEQELKTAFAGTYTDNYFTELANYALGELESATSRTAFTGSSSYLAKKAMICAAMEWISMFDRALFELAISSISENGASISFSGSLENYKNTFERLTAKLKIPSTSNYDITIADIDSDHTGLEGSILY